eukprot:6970322-Pyramimonas_sp.AAC.1
MLRAGRIRHESSHLQGRAGNVRVGASRCWPKHVLATNRRCDWGHSTSSCSSLACLASSMGVCGSELRTMTRVSSCPVDHDITRVNCHNPQ